MNATDNMDRREFFLKSFAAGAGFSLATTAAPAAAKEQTLEATANEDMMKEHALLDRVLLIYDQNLKHDRLDFRVVHSAAEIIREFVEDHHEKQEEDFIFSAMLKAQRQKDLVEILKDQHEVGRKITDRILLITKSAAKINELKLKRLIRSFVWMYRAHASREDTVLFPEFKKVVGPEEYAEIGEIFEKNEQKRFGPEGFESVLAKVEKLEKEMGLADLKVFTPRIM